MEIDVPDEVTSKVLAEGGGAWLNELPEILASLARDWSLAIGATLRGGHAALVVEADLADGTAAVLKVGVPGTGPGLGFEATALRTIDGDGCALLFREDLTRSALLMERLGRPMYDLVPDPATRHDLLCDVAQRLWRPLDARIGLPTGADQAVKFAELMARLWEETGRPCARRTLEDAFECAEKRRLAHDDQDAVLVHGDVHEMNALQAPEGGYRLIDPVGIRAEPAYDLGTIVRCNPDEGDDLRGRAARLAHRTGVDVAAIWEWGTVHRVASGLYSRHIGFQPFGDQLLAEADRLTG